MVSEEDQSLPERWSKARCISRFEVVIVETRLTWLLSDSAGRRCIEYGW
jgi:hypothetical protein